MASILVIDDAEGVRLAVCAVLRRAGHTVTEVDNGTAGLQLAAEYRFDLVITDIVMPGINGVEVVRALSMRFDRPPILVMSGGGAHAISEADLTLVKQTADGVLAKPFRSAELTSAVDQLLDKG
jgi:CheY-like chemotaxis protein